MADMGAPLDRYSEVETGEPFTLQNPRLLKVELSETTVMARNGAMVAYQGDVHFEHKGGGLGRMLKKAATGEALRLMQATGSGELFLASHARAAIAWSGGVSTSLKTDLQAKSLIGMGSGESVQLGLSGDGWVLVQPSEGRQIVRS
jgi:uncharacterized protein (AIM24 family)